MKTKEIETCHNCDKEFKNLSMHWSMSSECCFPELTDTQKQIITGVLMGDGTISRPGKNPLLTVRMVNKKYLEYLNEVLGKYGKGVYIKHTAKESAQLNRESGFRPNAREENYQDVYSLQSRTSPEFEEFADWYETGKKVFPKDIQLTPIILKHWYVCDGTYNTSGYHNNMSISAMNEIENFDKILRWFKEINISPSTSNGNIYISNGDSEELFDFMGSNPPGFEHKWPD